MNNMMEFFSCDPLGNVTKNKQEDYDGTVSLR